MPDSFNPDTTYQEGGYAYTIEDGGITTTVYFDDCSINFYITHFFALISYG